MPALASESKRVEVVSPHSGHSAGRLSLSLTAGILCLFWEPWLPDPRRGCHLRTRDPRRDTLTVCLNSGSVPGPDRVLLPYLWLGSYTIFRAPSPRGRGTLKGSRDNRLRQRTVANSRTLRSHSCSSQKLASSRKARAIRPVEESGVSYASPSRPLESAKEVSREHDCFRLDAVP
jgi:hypothetical protein